MPGDFRLMEIAKAGSSCATSTDECNRRREKQSRVECDFVYPVQGLDSCGGTLPNRPMVISP